MTTQTIRTSVFMLFITVLACSACGSTRAGRADGTPSWRPLVDALAQAEALHYDAFTTAPDAATVTITLHAAVAGGDFRGKDRLKLTDGAWYFARGPESETGPRDGVYIPPEALYADCFSGGSFQYAPERLAFLIGGVQTGIAVYMSDYPVSGTFTVTDYGETDGIVNLAGTLSRVSHAGGSATVFGTAVITLKKSSDSHYGYRIVSYQPAYAAFTDYPLH